MMNRESLGNVVASKAQSAGLASSRRRHLVFGTTRGGPDRRHRHEARRRRNDGKAAGIGKSHDFLASQPSIP